ncbi:MAG: beta-ketoacyl-ACP synthase II [Candidatus Goldbacteria bacterium]|nr:beta-ketoacyl-ACP synthase II [Candidatus Goldiibacteriota bacterium]
MKKRVVITGMGVITPVGNSVPEMWQALLDGKNGIGRITLFDTSQYDTKIAGEIKNFDPTEVLEKKEVKRTPRFIQYALKTAKEAIEMAQLSVDKVDLNRVAVLVGSGIGGINVIEEQQTVLLQKGPSRISPFLIPMLIPNMAGAFISMRYGFKGPNFCIVTACATGTHSIGEAFKLLQRGDADVAITGGTEGALTPLGLAGFCAAKSLSTRNDDPEHASRPFDKDRDGFVMADGAGIMVLETLEHAQRRGAKIIAEIAGYGSSDDAYHMTAPPPGGTGGALSMMNAINDAGIKPEDIDYINAHGTSTELNDKEETAAIKTVFGQHAYKLAISSTKSMTGHMLGGTGAVEAIVCALSCRDDVIHPTRNLENPSPECDLDYVPKVKRNLTVNYALSNSFGFGGHNATVIIKKYTP